MVPAAESTSWHSFRIYLACALLAAGADSETIKAMLRWRSNEALALYARVNIDKDAALRNTATAQYVMVMVDSIRTATISSIDPAAGRTAVEHVDPPERARREALLAAAQQSDVPAVDRARLPVIDIHDMAARIAARVREMRLVAASADNVTTGDDDNYYPDGA
jgi:hypothetical protein